MRKIFCLVAVSLLFGTASAAKPSLVHDQELSLGGVSLGDTEASVLRKLGTPRRVTGTGDFLSIRMDYPGLTVWLGEGRRVGEVLSKSKQYCTPAGICPGVPFVKAEAKYGPPLVMDREDGAFMEYPSSGSACWLQISVSKGIINSVRAECQP